MGIMTPTCCPCGCVSQQRPKTGIVEPEETAAARQRLGKHVSAATNTHITIEEQLVAVFICGLCCMRGLICSESKVRDLFLPEVFGNGSAPVFILRSISLIYLA
jgi:hypothetical protein